MKKRAAICVGWVARPGVREGVEAAYRGSTAAAALPAQSCDDGSRSCDDVSGL